MKKKIEFVVPGIPPSYNMSFKIAFKLKQIYLTQAARKFKDKVAIHMPYWELPNDANLKIKADIYYYSNWYFKNGKMKKKDIQNLDKLILDAIFNKLGIDDSHVWVNSNVKVQCKKEEKTFVRLEVMDEEN